MNRLSVTVKMTPRQAVEAELALTRAAVGTESPRLFAAAAHIRSGLYADGWDFERAGGTEDEPVWVWKKPGP